MIEKDEEFGIEEFNISAIKRLRTYFNQNREFKLEIIKKNDKDTSEMFLVLGYIEFQKLVRLLPKLQAYYESCLQGKQKKVRYRLNRCIHIGCDYQYKSVDVREFFMRKGGLAGRPTLHPTRRGVNFNNNEFKPFCQLIDNINTNVIPNRYRYFVSS